MVRGIVDLDETVVRELMTPRTEVVALEAKTDVKEDYVLIIDADMVMRRPIVPDPSSSLATSAFFGYMIGVNNELAVKVRVSLRCVLKRSSWP